MKRQSGILLHISSLPNRYGIGSFGKECYDFIDYLVRAGQSVWEILPLGQTGFGDSPYSSVCSYSYNPYFISLDTLVKKGLLKKSELSGCADDTPFVDFGRLYSTRYALLRKAFSRFDASDGAFVSFVKKGVYRDYALYMAIKAVQGSRAFYDWDDAYKYRDGAALREFERQNRSELEFWQFLQYEAKSEWDGVLAYARKRGITVIGDLPLYVAYDSVEVWANPGCFKLDERLTPKKVAGVPPDYFSQTGQLWGNPVYDYAALKNDGYAWWKRRFRRALQQCDIVRIDHFRGFDRYYEIDYGKADAREGAWVSVDGREVLGEVHKTIAKSRIIAEDLGIIDDGVRSLLADMGYPGMRILGFAFNGESDNPYLPERLEKNCVCYTGTHDNDTLMGLIDNASEWDYANLVRGIKSSCKKLGVACSVGSKKMLARTVIRLGFASKASIFILPMQDVALLNGDYRMNTPGREIANWTVKLKRSHFSAASALYLAKLCEKYNR